ncbi:hypothetical protein BD780_000002 [Clostridium tetanomorphum]|uniref:hypothetical protein n=1 Tax=Clostridium tetanomorphum TaxID=1553 RepID=UPI00156E51BD|nr:hypothetical protein [Clostridium tetanomorphum]NRS82777.1 hypothetical protein [Clostridium tetanomorphum]
MKFFKKLEDIKTSSYEPKEKIRKALVTLYENIESRQGIAKELVNNNINDLTKDPRILEFKERLTKNIEVSLAPIEKKTNFKNDVGINRRLSETLLLSIPILIESHKEEKDDNIEFLNGLLEAFIK